MKFAFSTTSCPKWDFKTIVSRAKEYGYDGVEIRGFLNESIVSAANVFVEGASSVRDIFDSAGIEIACLSSSIAMTGSRKKDQQALKDLHTYIDTARELNCRLVKVFDTQLRPGHSRDAAAVALGEWLLPAADHAAEHDMTIVIENALSFRTAKELWVILDRLNHPSIAACWDVFNAYMVGEDPSVSVPTLNSRIQYVQVKDANVGPLGTVFTKLGEGDVPVEKFIRRLRGIGYTGWITMEWEKAWLPNIAEPEEVLPNAVARLKEWCGINADVPAESDAEPAAAHAGAPVGE